jgi:hypothetical protein
MGETCSASERNEKCKQWRIPFSGMWCRVVFVWTYVSEDCIAFIFRVEESASEELAWASSCDPPKRRFTSQKTALLIVTALKTSDLTNVSNIAAGIGGREDCLGDLRIDGRITLRLLFWYRIWRKLCVRTTVGRAEWMSEHNRHPARLRLRLRTSTLYLSNTSVYNSVNLLG